MSSGNIERVIQYFADDSDADRLRSEFTNLEILGDHRRFVVARMGSTGSTWLAKVLNSHPDVFCTHEQVLSRSVAKESVSFADINCLIREIAAVTHHGAYRAAGDVGSVWLTHLIALRGKFKTALLLRHPARLLATRLKIFPRDQSFTQIRPDVLAAVQELWGIKTDRIATLDLVFLQDLFIFASQTAAVNKIDFIVRIEDLSDGEYCQQFLHALTGLSYDDALLKPALGKKVNRRTPEASVAEIVSGFSPQQQDWYRQMLVEVAPYFGYELYRDVPSARLQLPKRFFLSLGFDIAG